MNPLQYKPSVRFAIRRSSGFLVTAHPAILMLPELILPVWVSAGYPLIVTSVLDGWHSSRSLHHKGLAEDFRSWHLNPSGSGPMYGWSDLKRQVLEGMREIAAPLEYDVIWESRIVDSDGRVRREEHYHAEFDPKGAAT